MEFDTTYGVLFRKSTDKNIADLNLPSKGINFTHYIKLLFTLHPF